MKMPGFIKWIKNNGSSIWLSFLTLCIIAIILIAFGCLDDIVRFFKKEGWPIGENYKLEVVKLIAYILGGFLVLTQIVVLNRRAKATEKQAKAMADNIKVTEKGQVNERFKNAIQQLGSGKVPIRLGAIYTLHHIAKDSEELRKTIFDILCSYIRETTNEKKYKERDDTSMEIQSMLDLLFVNNDERRIYEGYEANLINAYLRNANLIKSNLTNVRFFNAHLEGAKLSGAHLERAGFENAHLEGAILNNAHLEGAYLWYTHLEGTNLQFSHLEGSIIWFAHFEGALIDHAHLEAAHLYKVWLEGTDFQHSNIKSLQSTKNLLVIELMKFEQRVNNLKDLETDIGNCKKGVLTRKKLNEIIEGLEITNEETKKEFEKWLQRRIDKETAFTDCITGKLTDAEAQKIIDRYNAAMKRKDEALKGIKKD